MYSNLDEDPVIELQIDCTELYEKEYYTQVLRISESQYIPSIEYFRKLIERELDIPRVCQLSLSVAGVPLDPLETMEECCLSHRLFKDPNPITLHYYTTSLNLVELSKLLIRTGKVINEKNITVLYMRIQEILSFLKQISWVSKEAVGTTLFIVRSGFVQKLKQMLILLNTKSESLLNQKKTTDSIMQFRVVMKCLSAITSFFWALGGSWEFLVFLSELGLIDEFIRTLLIANNEFVIKSMYQESIDLLHSCYGIFQMIIELKVAALRLGTDKEFLLNLKDTLLGKHLTWMPFDRCLQSVIFFCMSYHTVPSTQLYNTGVYTELLIQFENDAITYSNVVKCLFYNVNMMVLNALRTPNLVDLCGDFCNSASRLFDNFLQKVSPYSIVQYDQGYGVVWQVMENFVAFFFIPINSILGRIREGSYTSGIVDRYYRMAYFVLEVLLRQERHRDKIIAENLLDLLLVADWRTRGSTTSIRSMLNIYFPHLVYYPVPSLHDIAAVSAFCAGLGDFSDLIYS